MRSIIQVAALAVVGYTAHFVYTWTARLPPRIPTHFGFHGEPNAWGSPSTLWILVWAQLATTVLMLVLPALCARFPSLSHLGSRKLSDYDPAARAQVISLLADMSARIALATSLLFLYITRQTIGAALVPGTRMTAWPMLAFFGLILLILLVYTVKFRKFSAR